MTPIWINNRNRLTTTRKMVEFLSAIPGTVVTIIDNDSTYIPLLEWYVEYKGNIIFLKENMGPWAPWKTKLDLSMGSGYYVVTDSDLDLSGVPSDVLTRLQSGLDQFPGIVKTGLSLEIDDMPTKPIKDQVLKWEHRFWKRKVADIWWSADIDTTFAMYRGSWHNEAQCTWPALRSDRPYVARHIPWYRVMDDEEKYVEAHCETKWSSTFKYWKDKPCV
jgi:hypothetical protein